jgi:hypothetical protein
MKITTIEPDLVEAFCIWTISGAAAYDRPDRRRGCIDPERRNETDRKE